jgi:hypothetical protein
MRRSEPMGPARILVVANRSIATPALLAELRRHAADAPCEFVLLVPDAPPGVAGDWLLRHARRLFARATGAPVEAILARGRPPFDAIAETLGNGHFDEVILSTLPRWGSRWLRDGLPDRVERLGVPVTVVTPAGERAPAARV